MGSQINKWVTINTIFLIFITVADKLYFEKKQKMPYVIYMLFALYNQEYIL